MSLVGKILNQRFYILKPLGKGGFGHTYLAEDRKYISHPHCVVKHLQPSPENLPHIDRIKELFEQEAKILEKLSLYSNNLIPKLIDRFDEGNEMYLVQEFIEGTPLTDEFTPSRRFSQAETIELLIQLLTTLKYCHKETLIHRDLKPDNIMRRTNGDLVIIDFGLSKDMRAGSVTKKSYGGTPGYAPKEQIEYGKPEFFSDVYAVGMIAIQALTGLNPTELERNHQTLAWEWRDRCNVTDDFAAVLNKMVESLAVRRYQDAAEALAAVELLLTPQPLSLLQTIRIYILKIQQLTIPPQFTLASLALQSSYPKKMIFVVAGIFTMGSIGAYTAHNWNISRERAQQAEKYNNSGDTNSKNDKYKEALADYDKAIELEPKSVRAYNGRCTVNIKKNNLEKAGNDCDTAIALDPKSAIAYHNRGKIEYDRKRYLEAIANYNSAIKLNPNFAQAYFDRGDAKLERKHELDKLIRNSIDYDYDREAFEDYGKAIELDPENASRYFHRGYKHFDTKQYHEAIKDFDKAIELNIKSNESKNILYMSYEYRGQANLRLKRYQKAIDDYNQAIKLGSGSLGYLWRGDVKYELRKYQEAINDYDKSIKSNPTSDTAYLMRAEAKFNLKKYQEAIDDYTKAIEIEVQSETPYTRRGDARFNLKKYREAIDDYTKAIELYSGDESAYKKRGNAKILIGQKQDGIADYQQAANLYKEGGKTKQYQDVLKEIYNLKNSK